MELLAKSVVPDQTAPRSSLIWFYASFPNVYVPLFSVYTVYALIVVKISFKKSCTGFETFYSSG